MSTSSWSTQGPIHKIIMESYVKALGIKCTKVASGYIESTLYFEFQIEGPEYIITYSLLAGESMKTSDNLFIFLLGTPFQMFTSKPQHIHIHTYLVHKPTLWEWFAWKTKHHGHIWTAWCVGLAGNIRPWMNFCNKLLHLLFEWASPAKWNQRPSPRKQMKTNKIHRHHIIQIC